MRTKEPELWRNRIAPAFSVNSIPPPGVNARSQGRWMPDSTVDTDRDGAGPGTPTGLLLATVVDPTANAATRTVATRGVRMEDRMGTRM